MIQTEDEAGRYRTIKEVIDGKRRRVIKLARTGKAGPAVDAAMTGDGENDGEGVVL